MNSAAADKAAQHVPIAVGESPCAFWEKKRKRHSASNAAHHQPPTARDSRASHRVSIGKALHIPLFDTSFCDFYGVSFGRMDACKTALFSSPERRGFNCFLPMSFRNEMKITLTNTMARVLPSAYNGADYSTGD